MSSSPHWIPQSPRIDSLFDFSEGGEVLQRSSNLHPSSPILHQRSRNSVSLTLTRPTVKNPTAPTDNEAVIKKKREYHQSVFDYYKKMKLRPCYGEYIEGTEYFPPQDEPCRTTLAETQTLATLQPRLSLPGPNFFNASRVIMSPRRPRHSVPINFKYKPQGTKRRSPKESTRTGSSRPRKVLRGDDEDASSLSPHPQTLNPSINPISATNRNRPRRAAKVTKPKAVPKIVKRRVKKMLEMSRKLVIEIRLTVATEHTGRES